MTLVILTLAWLIGIWLAAAVVQPWPLWLTLALCGALAGLVQRRERSWRLGAAAFVLLALGALRLSLSPLHATPLRPYLDGRPVTLSGVVAEAPDVRAGVTQLVLAVDSVRRGGVAPPESVDARRGGVAPPDEDRGEETSPLRDAVLLRVPREAPYRYGDRLRVTGIVRTPLEAGDFSYRDYLARRGIHAVIDQPTIELLGRGGGSPIQAAFIALADRAEAEVAALWPAPESALMAGILLGREQGIPEPLLAAFDDSGTRHIIAISGFNITLLAGVLTSMLLTVLNRRFAAPIVIVLLACYVVLVGADPAVLRAGLMGGLTLLAVLAGRPGHALTGLAASALAMTLWRPWTLWEPSFQLSFAATLGLILLLPKIEASMERLLAAPADIRTAKGAKDAKTREGRSSLRVLRALRGSGRLPLPGWLREAVLVSLAAQLATLPITLGTFGRLSIVAPLANLLILPAQAAVMELGALATLLGLVWHPLGQLFAYLAWPFIAWTIAAVERLGALPWAAVDLRAAGLVPWLLYGLGGLLLWARSVPDRWRALTRRLPTKALVVGLAAGVALIWAGGVARVPDGRLHVTFLDVGQGDAILVQTPDGRRLLVDGGPDPTVLPAALGKRLAPWQRSLDLVALTHPDEDHLAGLVPVARRYALGLVLDTHLPHDTPTGQAWQTENATRDTPILYPQRGTTLDLGSGVRLQVLHPGDSPLAATRSDSNNNGLVLRLSYGRASFLLTGDLEMEGEQQLLRQEDLALDATVLKVAHHGARTATTLRFLEAVTPQVAVISVGAGNSYGHPTAEVLQRLQAAGAQVLRTDECGDVEVVTDGEQLWVRTERRAQN
ncbi:MAG TPA: DNA internalization-related competence protein ComEC/Rec2 [Anaerolineae bacterium]|nr:DNA internalization-related competence protein ComEC/Rec2 [Anaerolineae bacterium]